jgi:hypothetical protein
MQKKKPSGWFCSPILPSCCKPTPASGTGTRCAPSTVVGSTSAESFKSAHWSNKPSFFLSVICSPQCYTVNASPACCRPFRSRPFGQVPFRRVSLETCLIRPPSRSLRRHLGWSLQAWPESRYGRAARLRFRGNDQSRRRCESHPEFERPGIRWQGAKRRPGRRRKSLRQ